MIRQIIGAHPCAKAALEAFRFVVITQKLLYSIIIIKIFIII